MGREFRTVLPWVAVTVSPEERGGQRDTKLYSGNSVSGGFGMLRWSLIAQIIWLALMVPGVSVADDNEPAPAPLKLATEHRLRGRYEEATDAYEEILKGADLSEADRIAAIIGLSRVREETGHYDEAEEVVVTAIASIPKSPALLARHGEVCLFRGRYVQARDLARSGIDIDSQHVHSR